MLAMRGVLRKYPKKTIVINEGEEGDNLFVLLKGSVKAFSMDEEGREITYGKIHAGDYFGEMSLDGGRRAASVSTLEPCVCAVLVRSEIDAHLAAEPGFALHLVMQLIKRARVITAVARNMALLNVYSRLVVALETPDYEPDAFVSTSPAVLERLTHQDLASRIGASREMVSRLLKDLEKGGYIEMVDRRITLLSKLPTRW